MALDPTAFSPDANNDSQQPNMRRQRLSALMGGKASLGSLFNNTDDTSDLSKPSLNGGQTTSPLATPGLGASEPAGSPSLLSSERVPHSPNFAAATPLLTGNQQIGAELGEADRGEEGVIGGGAGRQGLSTADRNRALMSFFRPAQAQQSAQSSESSAPSEPTDTMKAVGSAKAAVGAAGRAKRLFSQSTPIAEHDPAASLDRAGAALSGPDSTGLTAADRLTGADAEFGPTESDSGVSLPDFTQPGTYGGGLSLLGSLANLFGSAGSNPTAAKAGGAASVAGQGVNAGINPTIGNAGSAIGAGLGLAGSLTDNPDLTTAGKATGAAANVGQAGYSLANGGGAPTGGWGGVLSAGSRLGTGAYGLSNSDASDSDKAVEAAHTIGMALADYYTGGLAEIGPMLGGLIGQDNPIGQMLLGGTAMMGKHAGASHYDLVRMGPQRQAQKELESLHDLYSHVPQGNLGATYGALRSQLDPRGAVRSYFQPSAEDAAGLGLTPNDGGYTNWRDMSPQQFNSVMSWIGQDPERLNSIMGSGDVGYMDQGEAGGFAGRAQSDAKALIARQLGLPYLNAGSGTMPWDVEANANEEARYQPERAAWYAAHPGVAAPAFTPTYGPQQATLQSLFDRAEQQWGNDRRQDPAGGG